MTIAQQIVKIADRLVEHSSKKFPKLLKIEEVALAVEKSWSGSWLGYQSRVYYNGFKTPPPGAHFSMTWGMGGGYLSETKGDWVEYLFEAVTDYIYERSGDIDLDPYKEKSDKVEEIFIDAKDEALSVIHANMKNLPSDDKFLQSLIEKIENIKIYSESDFVSASSPKGQFRCADHLAVSQGFLTPPHLAVRVKVVALQEPYKACDELRKILIKLYSHVNNIEEKAMVSERIGTNVFIGHGRSAMWRELKDFVQDKLHLPYDEFNRVPVAGVTNITRLAQMLEQSCIAFLVMTAEDEMMDGNKQARMNVVHEVGLFQGRLGFERAIVLLEEGCEEFSNINGLGQIRFPKGNISAVFQDIREVLEREKIIN
ncbi:TIR domain-containing protein [Klebsiella quasipneumoniae]|uniref:TIR domain-containing protein n=1 Tax=Klebsiella quasipneumoniae TaxID=1463165 RepID=UPI0007A07E2C|nr:TIR domain-containing protein [Klebsiella quasipneumoniae]KYZ72871.1 hypothetical protein A2G95_24060 [Klebsiella quasipneumoniae subsp. similipneumoniae]